MKNWKEIQNLKNKFFVYSANNLFLKKEVDFDVDSRDYTFILKGYSLLGTEATGVSKLPIWLDVDDTLNPYHTNGVSKNFYQTLAEFNPRVHSRWDKIGALLKKIMQIVRKPIQFKGEERVFNKAQIEEESRRYQPEFDKTVKKFTKELQECGVTEQEFCDAAEDAVEKTVLVSNIYPTLRKLEYMGFKLGISSSGPDKAILRLAKKLQILRDSVNSSIFNFNKGKLLDVDAHVGIRKNLSEEKTYDACVFVSDNWKADYYPALTIDLGLVVWITDDKVEKLPGNIYVRLPELRQNFENLLEFVQKYSWARVYSSFISPTATKELYSTIKQINHDANLCRNATKNREVFYYGKILEERVKNFLNRSRPVFPEDSYQMRKLLDELDLVEDIERYKNVIDDITNRVNESPLAKADDDYIRGLGEYMKEEKNLEVKEWVYGWV